MKVCKLKSFSSSSVWAEYHWPVRPPSLPAGSLPDGLKRQMLNWAWAELCSSRVWQYSMMLAHTWVQRTTPSWSATIEHWWIFMTVDTRLHIEWFIHLITPKDMWKARCISSEPGIHHYLHDAVCHTCCMATSISSRLSAESPGAAISACFSSLSRSLPTRRPSSDRQRRWKRMDESATEHYTHSEGCALAWMLRTATKQKYMLYVVKTMVAIEPGIG